MMKQVEGIPIGAGHFEHRLAIHAIVSAVKVLDRGSIAATAEVSEMIDIDMPV